MRTAGHICDHNHSIFALFNLKTRIAYYTHVTSEVKPTYVCMLEILGKGLGLANSTLFLPYIRHRIMITLSAILLITTSSHDRFMPKGLKSTSSQIVVSFDLSESGPNTFTTSRVDLQLNALDSEVFVVTGMKLDLETPDMVLAGIGDSRTAVFATLSKQDISKSASLGLGNPSVMGSSQIIVREHGITDVNNNVTQTCYAIIENDTDAPSHAEYIDIIATPDFFININGVSNLNAMSVSGKLYGYRAKADSATYAALVQSELLSQ